MSFLDRLLGRDRGGVLENRELTERILTRLDQGLSPSEVRDSLVSEGIRPRRATRMVELVLKVKQHGLHLFDSVPPEDGK